MGKSGVKPIRNSAKAVIIKDGKLLVTKNRDDWGIFYLLPGGGQEPGENLHDALRRELMEEISARVEIKDIILIREYIGMNHEFAQWDSGVHQIEFMFECVLLNEEELGSGLVPDNAQIGFEWLDIDLLGNFRIYPGAIKEYIGKGGRIRTGIYIGDTN